MALFTSYDLEGKKLSFANWISNLTPTDTFFVSVTGKEKIKNTTFQWQTDTLKEPDTTNAQKETDEAVVTKDCGKTTVRDNVTQILRKAIEVTDTADVLDNYGRSSELQYQLEKAGKEIKRDLEAILLDPAQAKDVGSSTSARKTAGFFALVAGVDAVDTSTTAVVHKDITTATAPADKKLNEKSLFEITYNLFLAGSSADIIMFHPSNAAFFSSLMDAAANTQRFKMIDNMDTTLNKFVGSLIDPLGQQYKLVPNRFMPKDHIYFFNPKDWTQMVLRAPERIKLAKMGSSEQYMIEMELGLRHRNPYASGILKFSVA